MREWPKRRRQTRRSELYHMLSCRLNVCPDVATMGRDRHHVPSGHSSSEREEYCHRDTRQPPTVDARFSSSHGAQDRETFAATSKVLDRVTP